MNARTEYEALLAYCKKQGITVRIVGDNELHDYAAMNEMAAKRIGFPCKKNEILLDRNPDMARRVRNLRHELIERNLMREGRTYWEAHCISLKREKQRCQRMR
jgi:hypothetical protein